MRMLFNSFVLLYLFQGICHSLVANSHIDAGVKVAQERNTQTLRLKDTDPQTLGIGSNEHPPEIHVGSHDFLNQKKQESAQGDAVFQRIKTANNDIAHDQRLHYVLKVDNPLKEGRKVIKKVVTKTAYKTCFQEGDPYIVNFKEYLVIDLKLIPEIKILEPYCEGHLRKKKSWYQFSSTRWYEYCHPGCKSREVVKQNRQVKIMHERWQGDAVCHAFDDLSDTRFDVESDIVSSPPETRVLQAVSEADENGVIHREGENITRPCWEKTYTYKVIPKSCFDCHPYIAQRCRPIAKECVEALTLPNGVALCVKYKATYACEESYTVEEDLGDLSKTNLMPKEEKEFNQNMYKVLAQLEALKQIEQHQEGDANIAVFKGDEKRCSKNFGGGFKDCCQKNGGWGTQLGVGKRCSADEESLRQMRQENRCVTLPGVIKHRTLGVVTSKHYGFCCFPTALSRAIQEGARRQLGLTFGSIHSAQCRGLRMDELSKADLGQMDLSDAFPGITKSTQKMQKDLAQNFKQKQETLRSSASNAEAFKTSMAKKNTAFTHNQTFGHVEGEHKTLEVKIRHDREQKKARGE